MLCFIIAVLRASLTIFILEIYKKRFNDKFHSEWENDTYISCMTK